MVRQRDWILRSRAYRLRRCSAPGRNVRAWFAQHARRSRRAGPVTISGGEARSVKPSVRIHSCFIRPRELDAGFRPEGALLSLSAATMPWAGVREGFQ